MKPGIGKGEAFIQFRWLNYPDFTSGSLKPGIGKGEAFIQFRWLNYPRRHAELDSASHPENQTIALDEIPGQVRNDENNIDA